MLTSLSPFFSPLLLVFVMLGILLSKHVAFLYKQSDLKNNTIPVFGFKKLVCFRCSGDFHNKMMMQSVQSEPMSVEDVRFLYGKGYWNLRIWLHRAQDSTVSCLVVVWTFQSLVISVWTQEFGYDWLYWGRILQNLPCLSTGFSPPSLPHLFLCPPIFTVL